MHGQNVVAVYSSRSTADAAQARLIEAGVPASDIRISAESSGTAPATTAHPAHERGFFDWLFGDAPTEHQTWYANNLREGRTAVSVYVRGQDQERIQAILEEFESIEIDEEAVGAAQTGLSVAAASARGTTRAGSEGDQVIPLAKEELQVGKRNTERRYKVRSYVVERPVEQEVHLRDERVTIERRPVGGDRSGVAAGVQGREFEVVERHEEPVVTKKSRATEEVVVRREARDRVETVRDNVRETKVDVDKGGATGKKSKVAGDRAAAGGTPGIGGVATDPALTTNRKI